MDEMDYWRLCDELTIDQAAHLLIDCPPNMQEALRANGADLIPSSQTSYILNLEAATAAIISAFKKGKVNGKSELEPEYDMNGNIVGRIEGKLDIHSSIIDVDSLKAWLASRGFKTGFFFPEDAGTPDYLDPQNPRYAPKLAASVNAWLSVTDPGKKSPKQALDKWLREHATQFELSNDEGKPIEQAIEECSKVANWNAKGGATKTPG